MTDSSINFALFVPALLLIFQGVAFFRLPGALRDDAALFEKVKSDPFTRLGGFGFSVLGALIALFSIAGLFAGRLFLIPLLLSFAAASAVMAALYFFLALYKRKK